MLATRPRDDATPVGRPVTLAEVQALTDAYAGTSVRVRDPAWMTNFRLHHRGAARYRAEHRHPGRGQPGLEARARQRGREPGGAARLQRARARARRGAVRLRAGRAAAFRTVSQLGIGYRGGPLAAGGADAPRHGPRAGDRAGDRLPDGPVSVDGAPSTLHRVLAAPGFNLLVRPDGHLAYRGATALAGLHAHLGTCLPDTGGHTPRGTQDL